MTTPELLMEARSDTRYELPRGGATLLGYIVRRMHKTALLRAAPERLAAGRPEEALCQTALYAAGASASFGPAYYQPEFNAVGDAAVEADPATGAQVTARLLAVRPHYRITYSVDLPDGGAFTGEESITGTTVSLTGLGMPAPSRFRYTSPDGGYTAEMSGIITSELAPAFFSGARIRGYGELKLRDSAGNTGRLRLTRDGRARVRVETPDGRAVSGGAEFAPE